MTTVSTRVTELDPGDLSIGWVLILGGVTREGNRRARRASKTALQAGLDAVWFDGFEETRPDNGTRVQLDVDGSKGDLIIVGFAEAEAQTMSSRFRLGGGLRSNPVSRKIWSVFLRRVGNLLRSRACWKVIRDDVQRLTNQPVPSTIVYCDDSSITSAWRAGQLWSSVPIATEIGKRTA